MSSSSDNQPVLEVEWEKDAEGDQVDEKENTLTSLVQGMVQIGTHEPPRPDTLASSDHSPEQVAKQVKYTHVRTIPERRARKRSEWKYLILFIDSLPQRPKTSLFATSAVEHKELESPDLLVPSEEPPPPISSVRQQQQQQLLAAASLPPSFSAPIQSAS